MSALDGLLLRPLRLDALTGALDAVVVPFHVALYGAAGDGVTDDTAAILAAFTDWQSSARPGCIQLENRDYLVSGPITITVGLDEYLFIEGNGARLIASPTFTGTLLHIVLADTGASADYKMAGIAVQNLVFTSSWTTPALNTALRIETADQSTGQPEPSVSLTNLTFSSTNNVGDWAVCIDLFSVNVTRSQRIYGHLKSSTSILIRIDTNAQISVGHSISNVVMTGGGTALQLGHEGATGPLQGVSVVDFNVACVNGIVWYALSNTDQLTVTNGQINCTNVGIQVEDLTSLIVTGVYFLQCAMAIKAYTSSLTGAISTRRAIISGCAFYAGPPNVAGVPNYCIVLQNVNSGPDSGITISGNVFTNLYAGAAGVNASPIQISGNSNYVTVVGNTSLGQPIVNDISGLPNNFVGGNSEGGTDIGGGAGFVFRSAPVFTAGLTVGPGVGGKANIYLTGNSDLNIYSPSQNIDVLSKTVTLVDTVDSGASPVSIGNNAGVLALVGTNVMVGAAGQGISFFGHGYSGQSTVSGSVASATATTLKSLISALAAYGLIVDGTSA